MIRFCLSFFSQYPAINAKFQGKNGLGDHSYSDNFIFHQTKTHKGAP